jgi:hypothetical protein
MHPWLQTLRHDLVKRVVWAARDQRESGLHDLALLQMAVAQLTDPEGQRTDALGLWEILKRDAPVPTDGFERALHAAVAGLQEPWPAPLEKILALEPAFEALARLLES